MTKKNNHIVLMCCLFILAIAFLSGHVIRQRDPTFLDKLSSRAPSRPEREVSIKQASAELGFNIPLPKYLPPGYVLEGVYVLPVPDTTEGSSQPIRQLQPFYVRFENDRAVMVMSLHGGDTRSRISLVTTGGDIPDAFGLSGQGVHVSSSMGLVQCNLDEFGALGERVQSRIVWRFPCRSSRVTELKAIFLNLESDTLPPSDLLEIARSVE